MDSPFQKGYEKTPSPESGGRYFQRNQASLLSFRVMLLFLRAALFLCRRPFRTALSTVLTATTYAASALALSPAARADSNFFRLVFSSDLSALFFCKRSWNE